MPSNFCTPRQALEILGISLSTLKRLRRNKQLVQDVHYVYLSDRAIRYNSELVRDWMANRSNPKAHEQAIADYFANLPSNRASQRKTRKSA
jgi:predicted site-specific integrase-resolvase